MRCPRCNYISFDQQDHCLKCSADLSAIAEGLRGTGLNVEPPFLLGGVLGEAEAEQAGSAMPSADTSFDDVAVDLDDLDVGGGEADLDLSSSSFDDEEETAMPSLGLEDLDVADLMPATDEEVPELDLGEDSEAEGGIAFDPQPEPEPEAAVEPDLDEESGAESDLDLSLEAAAEEGVEDNADQLRGGIEMDIPDLDQALSGADDSIDLDLSSGLDEMTRDASEGDTAAEGEDIVDLSSLMGFGDSDAEVEPDLDLGLSLEGDNDLTGPASKKDEKAGSAAAEIPDLHLTLESDDD
ncbi:MAG: hypothetical protein OEY01_12590 [Desulfobulbaceae bacterium]|nr:hypothetical protein [Desulfobulbaceae bacterium]HIJ79596.1 hypothetical protein [Deltaproteobacteria bacterium]